MKSSMIACFKEKKEKREKKKQYSSFYRRHPDRQKSISWRNKLHLLYFSFYHFQWFHFRASSTLIAEQWMFQLSLVGVGTETLSPMHWDSVWIFCIHFKSAKEMSSLNTQTDCFSSLSWLYNMHCACDYHWFLLYPVSVCRQLKGRGAQKCWWIIKAKWIPLKSPS